MSNHLSGVLLSHPKGAPQQEKTGGKGAKGGNCLQQSGASDSSTISIMSTSATDAGLRRPAWRKPAETGGNSLQELCSRNCPRFRCLTLGASSGAKRLPHYRKYRKFLPGLSRR